MSIATENFLKTIYQLSSNPAGDCKTGNVAKRLGVTNAAATDMARKLASKDLIVYKKYQPLSLTKEGDLLALNIIRKHRLWETFLYRTFGMNMHEIHIEAEGLEHQTSDFLADKISEYLGFPEFDPHGDPIPSADGTIVKDLLSIVLNEVNAMKKYKIVRMVSDDEEFFDFCSSSGIETGGMLEVVNQFSKSKLTEIKIGGKTLLLHSEFTQYIHVHEIN